MEPVPEALDCQVKEEVKKKEGVFLGTVPGTHCSFISAGMLRHMLAQPTEPGKKMNPEPLKSMKLGVDLVFHDHSIGKAEIHKDWDDVWEGIEGQMTFVLDGQLDPVTKQEIAPGEFRAESILGGKTIILGPGDQLIIPAGTPHQNMCLDGVAKAGIVKRLRGSLLGEVRELRSRLNQRISDELREGSVHDSDVF